ncbi:MAG: hypothetical protein QGI75_02275 [Phycisphaerales bacterium]|nr:hypothetical protein [Phycisphaerales bacterium]MDP6891432.1 hypothetical protein [Phycisphaerales bacterium]
MPQQYAITSRESNKGPQALGSRREIIEQLSTLNTGPAQPDDDVLWGPGLRLEMTPGQDPVTQMLLTIVEEEIAWLSIMKLARICQWRIVDVETGHELEPV